MKLSVIIVNYNVQAYLEQCLRTVEEALKGIAGEVFVVDNQSTDGSVEMVRRKFPGVHLIANRENVGFSRANNQAIRASTGEYVLLLNPDTVVGEDVFHRVLDFLDSRPVAGGLGVKMIDGTGRFLPESKRGLPTPTVAFFKIMGLSRLFPKSRYFGRYHLGHLPDNEAASIEILSGACMFLRRKVLDQVGLLDESFFMYGEDIDLSYRITLGGHENWYFPDARIIHYKGESTKKSSVNYVFVFYNAMVIFARKHFTRRGPQLFSAIIRGAIYLSAAAALVTRFLRKAMLPMVDLAMAWLVAGLMHHAGWAPPIHMAAIGAMIGVMGAFGSYDRPMKWANILKGLAALVAGAFLLRPWTGIAGGAVVPLLAAVAVLLLVVRMVLHGLGIRRNFFSTSAGVERARILALGLPMEAKLALGLLWQTHYGLRREITLGPDVLDAPAGVDHLRASIRDERIHEVVFCAENMATRRIIAMMELLRDSGPVFKIAQPGAAYIIGPNSTESLQDLLVLRDHAVNNAASLRSRKLMDITLSILFLISMPVGIWFIQEKRGFLRNIRSVLRGRKSWMGYVAPGKDRRLPRILPGVLSRASTTWADPAIRGSRLDVEYAKDYRVWSDMGVVMRSFKQLGALARP